MSLRSVSRRLQRLESSSGRYLWIVDMRRFPGKSREEAVCAFGRGRTPNPQDVVMFSDENDLNDPFSIMRYGDLHIFGDPAGRTIGQVIIDAAATAPQSRLSSLIKSD